MKRGVRLVLIGVLATLAACINVPPPMYMWENFPRQQYDILSNPAISSQEQITLMQAHAQKAAGAGASLPPGFRAHLGMLQLSAGNRDMARANWQAEKAAFPESTVYMDQLLTRLDPPAPPPVAQKPVAAPAPVGKTAAAKKPAVPAKKTEAATK